MYWTDWSLFLFKAILNSPLKFASSNVSCSVSEGLKDLGRWTSRSIIKEQLTVTASFVSILGPPPNLEARREASHFSPAIVQMPPLHSRREAFLKSGEHPLFGRKTSGFLFKVFTLQIKKNIFFFPHSINPKCCGAFIAEMCGYGEQWGEVWGEFRDILVLLQM